MHTGKTYLKQIVSDTFLVTIRNSLKVYPPIMMYQSQLPLCRCTLSHFHGHRTQDTAPAAQLPTPKTNICYYLLFLEFDILSFHGF